MSKYCSNCGEILPNNGFVKTPDNNDVCLECGKKLYPTAFNNLAIYIFEDGTPGIILPKGVLIPKKEFKRLSSTVSDIALEDYYQQIAKKTNFSKNKIKKMVEDKIESLSSLVSEETALRLIAQELNITLKDKFL